MPKSTASLTALAEMTALASELAKVPTGDPEAARKIALDRVRAVSEAGRAEAEKRLIDDGGGSLCARRISDLQDALIATVLGFAEGIVEQPRRKAESTEIAVIAVGGYGRRTLAPGSDIDLLFLSPGSPKPYFRRLVEYVLYFLWDLGFKVGHATRTVDECVKLSRQDMTIRTAILESRLITGASHLADELAKRFDTDVVRNTASEFVAAKLAERSERHTKHGGSRYLVEPNIKESKGGLRDLQTLFWIAKYAFRTDSTDKLVKAGVFSRRELNRFLKAEDFLWAIRCHLHFMTGRAEERLLFEHQRDMAVRLGYTDHPGLKDVERFMKHYFLVAKDVGDLTRIVCAELEEHHVKAAPTLKGLMGRRRPARRKIRGTNDFVVDHERINLAKPDVFERDPVNLIRFFALAEKHKLPLHPDATHAVTRNLKLINAGLRTDAKANKLFLEILTSPHQPEATLRAMNETGVLGRFIPDFGKIVAMMQFNMYHQFTVDEHLIRAVGVLSRIEHGDLAEQHPLSSELIKSLKDRVVLYVAVLLHDIAKGRIEDHSIAGARVARRLGPRLGLDEAQVDTVAWLIETHLVMSTFAQRRDLQDMKTIQDFAAIVQDPERLKLLLILTVTDIRSVGHGVWNAWKGQLLRTLYWETVPVLTGGRGGISRAERVEQAKEELFGALSAWPEAERKRYIARHYPSYLLRVDVPHKLSHAALIREMEAAGERLLTSADLLPFQGVSEVTILAPDHSRLLSFIAGACAVAGANIVDAQISTTVDGLAIDTVFISREFDRDEDEERRAKRIKEVIEQAVRGETKLPERVAIKGGTKAKYKPFRVPTRIRIDNSWSNLYTAIEAAGLDRPGLLYDLTRALSDLNLNIGSAHIATYGERAVDVFYVTDLIGEKIESPERQAVIERRLEEAINQSGKATSREKRSAA